MLSLKKFISLMIVFVLLFIICCIPSVFACAHEHLETILVTSPTCVETGVENIVCLDCDEVLETRELSVSNHIFGDYIVEVVPQAGKNGREVRICECCNYEETREIFCPHDDVISEIIQMPTCGECGIEIITCNLCGTVMESSVETIPHGETDFVIEKEPTCFEEGVKNEVCTECGNVVKSLCIDKVNCTFGDWSFSKYATPFESGERYRVCSVCKKVDTSSYTVEMENNSLYIPSANIYCKISVDGFTQESISNNDVVLSNSAYSVYDPTNPFIFGYWFGSLKTLYNTEVGENIYVCVDGQIETYEVVNSEYAVQFYQTYIIGQTTGVNIWDSYGSDVNSNYASNGKMHYGVDRWEDEDSGKTLHLYTSHNGADKEEWKPSHGKDGRWIVLANLIDTYPVCDEK